MEVQDVCRLIAACKTEISNLSSRLQAAKESLAAAVTDGNEYAAKSAQVAELQTRVQCETERLETLKQRHIEIDAALKPAALAHFRERFSPLIEKGFAGAALRGRVLSRAGEKMGPEYENVGTTLFRACQGFEGKISQIQDMAENCASGVKLKTATAAIAAIEECLNNDPIESIANNYLEVAWKFHSAYATRELGGARGDPDASPPSAGEKSAAWAKFQEELSRLSSAIGSVAGHLR